MRVGMFAKKNGRVSFRSNKRSNFRKNNSYLNNIPNEIILYIFIDQIIKIFGINLAGFISQYNVEDNSIYNIIYCIGNDNSIKDPKGSFDANLGIVPKIIFNKYN